MTSLDKQDSHPVFSHFQKLTQIPVTLSLPCRYSIGRLKHVHSLSPNIDTYQPGCQKGYTIPCATSPTPIHYSHFHTSLPFVLHTQVNIPFHTSLKPVPERSCILCINFSNIFS